MNEPVIPPDRSLAGAVLLGPDHAHLGGIAVEPVGFRAAAGLSPGRFPKGYPHVDPNEDAVAVFTDERRWLLVVADGHGGAAAAVAAVQAIAARAGSLLAAHPEEAARTSLLLGARAVGDVRASSAPSSGTALLVASIGPEGAHLTGAGDSVAYVVTGRRVTRVDAATPFVEHSGDTVPVIRRVALRSTSTLVLATDGLGDFLGRRWSHVVRSARAATAPATVEALIQSAHRGGAGDNVAVAALTPAFLPT